VLEHVSGEAVVALEHLADCRNRGVVNRVLRGCCLLLGFEFDCTTGGGVKQTSVLCESDDVVLALLPLEREVRVLAAGDWMPPIRTVAVTQCRLSSVELVLERGALAVSRVGLVAIPVHLRDRGEDAGGVESLTGLASRDVCLLGEEGVVLLAALPWLGESTDADVLARCVALAAYSERENVSDRGALHLARLLCAIGVVHGSDSVHHAAHGVALPIKAYLASLLYESVRKFTCLLDRELREGEGRVRAGAVV